MVCRFRSRIVQWHNLHMPSFRQEETIYQEDNQCMCFGLGGIGTFLVCNSNTQWCHFSIDNDLWGRHRIQPFLPLLKMLFQYHTPCNCFFLVLIDTFQECNSNMLSCLVVVGIDLWNTKHSRLVFLFWSKIFRWHKLCIHPYYLNYQIVLVYMVSKTLDQCDSGQTPLGSQHNFDYCMNQRRPNICQSRTWCREVWNLHQLCLAHITQYRNFYTPILLSCQFLYCIFL